MQLRRNEVTSRKISRRFRKISLPFPLLKLRVLSNGVSSQILEAI